MKLPRSSFYYQPKSQSPERMEAEAYPRDKIEAICLEYTRYGYRWVKTTDSRYRFPRYPNLIKGMIISRLNQVWLSDITYIRIRTGFVYLAAILDALG